MEIGMSEAEKRILKLSLFLLRKKLGESASIKAIHDDMLNCGNLGIRRVHEILNADINLIKCKYQRELLMQLSELFMWFGYKDTGYRDEFFYTLDDVLSHADEIRKLIKPYVKSPEKWHVNQWMDSRLETRKQIAEGKILKGSVSIAESVHVPDIQKKRFSELLKK